MAGTSAGAIVSKYVTTNDGVRLHYLEAGTGKPLVLLHGFTLAAELFKSQIDAFRSRYRVIAPDLRGHGESEKPKFGLKIHRPNHVYAFGSNRSKSINVIDSKESERDFREKPVSTFSHPALAQDLRDVLLAADADGVTLLGHSMGCSVIWAYWELYGGDRLDKLILVDQPAMMTANPEWAPETRETAGAILTPTSLWDMANGFGGPHAERAVSQFIDACVTRSCAEQVKAWICRCSLRVPREDARQLLINHGCQDWRDTIVRISVPTLVIAARASLVPWRSVAWIAQQIPGAEFEIFEEAEGGGHLMFIENPAKFNAIVARFAA